MVPFKKLQIGDKFKFNNRVWVRIPDIVKKKSCCEVLYNCETVDEPIQRLPMSGFTKVKLIEEPTDES